MFCQLFFFLYLFYFIGFVIHLQLTTEALHLFNFAIMEPAAGMRDPSEAENYNFYLRLLLFLNQASIRRELWDIVPGAPDKEIFEVDIK